MSLLLILVHPRTQYRSALDTGAGEGTVSVIYQNYYLTGHYSVDGRKTPNGATHSKAVAVEFEYGLTDR